MNIQQFRYLLAVADYLHFEVAAEKCCITQSTLSTMISRFEDEVNIQIFDRKKKPVKITHEGQLLLDQIRIIDNNINGLSEIVKEIKGDMGGSISISVIPTVSPYIMPLFLNDFLLMFPHVKIEISELTTHEIIRRIKSRDLDIGIVSIPINDKELIEIELYDEPFVYFSYDKTPPSHVNLEDINFQKLWLLNEGHCMRTQVLRICELKERNLGLDRNFEFKAGSIDSLIRLVKTNQASTLLPYLSAIEFSKEEGVYLKEINNPVPFRKIGLVFHRHFAKGKVIAALKKTILDQVLPLLAKDIKDGIMIAPLE